MKERIIAIFDVGKTNKKLLLFNEDMKVAGEEESRFNEITDEEGFPCDDIEHIELWIRQSVETLAKSDKYDLVAVNFVTYGATLVYLDEAGRRLTPVYNYLKPIDERIPEKIYRRYGGTDEFSRRTASPALGMLNSGMQAWWLKTSRPEVFAKVKYILHLPQYLSFLLTGQICTEHTSIGCHTALWDFDNMCYHPWVNDQNLPFPDPMPVNTVFRISVGGKMISVGIGLHDSSSSLAPYFSSDQQFLLISTGTWCINMNPFNNETLTAEQLDHDCLCYMSIGRQPVKASRLFMGKMHEDAVLRIAEHFIIEPDFYKKIVADPDLVKKLWGKNMGKNFFFNSTSLTGETDITTDMYEFAGASEAYHQLMSELTELNARSVRLVLPSDDKTNSIYITGGFSGNSLFRMHMAKAFPDKNVFTSDIANASALGAALVTNGRKDPVNLGLSLCRQ